MGRNASERSGIKAASVDKRIDDRSQETVEFSPNVDRPNRCPRNQRFPRAERWDRVGGRPQTERAGTAGRQGRQPIRATARTVWPRSRWSLIIVKNFTTIDASGAAGRLLCLNPKGETRKRKRPKQSHENLETPIVRRWPSIVNPCSPIWADLLLQTLPMA